MYCPDCGHEAAPADRFCQQCGRSLDSEKLYRETPAPAANHTALAILAHVLGLIFPVIGAFILMLIQNRQQDSMAGAQIREALNFQLSAFFISIAIGMAGIVFSLVTLGLGVFLFAFVWWALGIAYAVLCIVGAIKCANGELYRYPFNLRLFN